MDFLFGIPTLSHHEWWNEEKNTRKMNNFQRRSSPLSHLFPSLSIDLPNINHKTHLQNTLLSPLMGLLPQAFCEDFKHSAIIVYRIRVEFKCSEGFLFKISHFHLCQCWWYMSTISESLFNIDHRSFPWRVLGVTHQMNVYISTHQKKRVIRNCLWLVWADDEEKTSEHFQSQIHGFVYL